MYVDTQLEFSNAQAVTSTAISTNVVDLLTTKDAAGTAISPNTTVDIGAGEDVYLVIQTQTAATDTSSDATLTITLESDTVVGLSSSPTVHYSTGALAFATFSPVGTRLVTLKLPLGQYKRYLGVRYTVASGPLTAGAFDAFLTTDATGLNRPYASGFSVA
jgi:hypothetical protein